METDKPRIIKFKQTYMLTQSFFTCTVLHTHLENLPGKQALSDPSELNLHHFSLSLSYRQPKHIPLSSQVHSSQELLGSPSSGIGHSPGEGDGLRTGQDVGLWMGPAWQGQRPGRADCEELKPDLAAPSLEQC